MNGDSCCTPKRTMADEASAESASGASLPRVRVRTGSLDGMKLIPGGDFLMGSSDADGWAADGEGPVRKVQLQPFYIDACCVTNEQFNAFVNATGYKTEAERFGWSFVFHLFLEHDQLARVAHRVVGSEWWCRVEGARWRQPEGPGSTI